MPRKTRKYTEACKVLGLPDNADIPHEAVYGMLALRFYQWNGETWVRTGQGDKVALSGSIRISARGGDSELISLALIDILPLIGLEVTNIRGPYQDRKSDKIRFYLTFIYTK